MTDHKPPSVQLDDFNNHHFDRGRGRLLEILWLLAGALVGSFLPGSGWRRGLLRAFGARIGPGVVIKPRLRVKFPWRLEVGDFSWLGESVWIDNLATVQIGAHCCVSQGVYLCTGSHSWSSPGFDLITAPIEIEDQAWLAAFSQVGPGTRVGQGAVLQLGAVLTQDAQAWTRYRGNPASPCGPRQLQSGSDAPSEGLNT